MTDITQDTQADLEALAKSRLLSQFKEQPDIISMIGATLTGFAELERQFELLRTARDVDSATGDALDKLGDLVGVARLSRTDDLYRVFIKGQIAANQSTGSSESVYDIARAMVDSTNTLVVKDYDPAHFKLTVGGTAAPTEIVSMLTLVKSGKSAGVGFTGVHSPVASANTFTIGAIADYPETDNDTGIGNVAMSQGGELGGVVV